MITVNLTGRLGNMLFQYAIGRNLAIKNNTDLSLNLISYMNKWDPFGKRVQKLLNNFNLKAKYYLPFHKLFLKPFGNDKLLYSSKTFYEKSPGFDPLVLSLPDGTFLSGYFQSERYFGEISNVIREDLSIDSSVFNKEIFHYLDEIKASESVGLHVRRGDYLIYKVLSVCTLNYYSAAIEFINKSAIDPKYFVFSDDLDWCKKNLIGENISYVEIKSSRQNPTIDLYLMSRCKHNIIANSTFSWWAAWLNMNPDKIVVAPERWFNDENRNKLANQYIIPERWQKISCDDKA